MGIKLSLLSLHIRGLYLHRQRHSLKTLVLLSKQPLQLRKRKLMNLQLKKRKKSLRKSQMMTWVSDCLTNKIVLCNATIKKFCYTDENSYLW